MNTYFSKLFFTFFLFVSTNLIGQISNSINKKHSDKIDKLIIEIKKLLDKSIESKSLQPEKSLKFSENAFDLAKQIKDDTLIAITCYEVGSSWYMMAEHSQAMKFYLQSLDYSEKCGHTITKCRSAQYIGVLYGYQHNYKQALYYLNESNDCFISYGDSTLIGSNLNLIAWIYSEQKLYDKAIEIGEKAKSYIKGGHTFNSTILAEAYMNNKQYKKAFEYATRAYEISSKGKDANALGETHKILGKVYEKMEKSDSAIYHMEKAIQYFQRLNSSHDLSDLYGSLSNIYANKGDYKKAYECHELFSELKDSSIIKSQIDKVRFEFDEKQTRLQHEKEKRYIEIEQEKKQLHFDIQKKKQQLVITVITLGLLLTIIIALFILLRWKQTKKQKAIIEDKNVLIQNKQKEITDSINYAKRIQYSLLAHDELMKNNLPQHFVFFKPKDIVSGDFYWAILKNNLNNKNRNEETFYLAVCDSTGHGVPGAFMSLLNISYLNEAITEKNITQPHEVLNHVRKKLIENIDAGKDGMDGILACFRQGKLIYSASNNRPILVRDNCIIELTADRMPVGNSEKMKSFSTHEIDLKKNDWLLFYTDGYADQFGGEKGKKFKYKTLNKLILENNHLSPTELKLVLSETFDKWKGELEQVDDVCIIGVKI